MLTDPSTKGVGGIDRVVVSQGYPILTLNVSSMVILENSTEVTLTVTVYVVIARSESVVHNVMRLLVWSKVSQSGLVPTIT